VTAEPGGQCGADRIESWYSKIHIEIWREEVRVNSLAELLSLPDSEKTTRGLAHTPAEIARQPGAWLSTELFRRNYEQIAEFLALAAVGASSRPAPTVFRISAGTSDDIEQLFRQGWHCEVIVPSTDLLTHVDDWMIPERKYLWICFSRSGDSPERAAVLESPRRNRPDIHHLVISCNVNGRIIRESADDPQVPGICWDDAVNDSGLARTSSFSDMVIFGQSLAPRKGSGRCEEILLQPVQAGRDFLPPRPQIALRR
jgi:tagatose-6-phosphate ketose/aldose isomerase